MRRRTWKRPVVTVVPFGAFVDVAPGKSGLVHVSEYGTTPVADMTKVAVVGDTMDVMVIGKSFDGKIKLSRKAVLLHDAGEPLPDFDAAPAFARGGGGGGGGGGAGEEGGERPRFGAGRGGGGRGGGGRGGRGRGGGGRGGGSSASSFSSSSSTQVEAS
ncbi:hypothetical protein Rsub_03229 [Raphidocelis subcapitata]|uniref:S1 motif domain-containing protein n=1 Tax=Raphidocelis subcapitata TaxID=307507 RepID=A0A2V0P0E4_9CHLO|nr:hypothetical protein Rsub_03229 [Raphidocelis subcapitata]|eukprot:GBF90657.1 hypothetical protein Rsub_03229 [Raphidocelis subcapitata]